ncbi:MAG: excinuclease ABC subunit UvrB [Candidatus Liptonbacteria bacterium]|nr:excinuclease ABC subunit UvrB [Candidatus Liptonbacteria bacterium]
MPEFKIVSKNIPAGDQPRAIKELVSGLKDGLRHQTLLGVTGSGKTFTMANVIQAIQKPTLVIAHNKTLAAQLCNEFRELFPKNAVHYFVSYYDYYQPEAYMPTSDTYIEKEAMINEEIDKLRHAATTALLTRKDVIVVASVSCIYGLGAPETYAKNILYFKVGEKVDRKLLVRQLISMQFSRTPSDLKRGSFRLRGDNWEIMPPDRELIYNFKLNNDVIEKIFEIIPAEGFRPGVTPELPEIYISPAKHFITGVPDRERATLAIKKELKERLKYFEKNGKLLEAERLERRTKFDLAMMREVGYCHGIENYSQPLSGRAPGEPPSTLLDYFPRSTGSTHSTRSRQASSPQASFPRQSSGQAGQADFLTIIDESHVTVPQIGGMFEGDSSRKRTLIEYGFRLPSAADNRPLRFSEFNERVGQIVFTTATPGPYEKKISERVVEQIIRPTGLVDPKITILPAVGQVQDLIPRIVEHVSRKGRVLITTLTKKMAEDLTEYLSGGLSFRRTQPESSMKKHGSRIKSGMTQDGSQSEPNINKIKVAYLHSDVETLERIKILTNLRKGNFDVLVGVNLLREGLDLPEVTLVAILDADKEGFLRSETALIQTIGRASRNVRGEVLMYADHMTGSLERAIKETDRRREIQLAYNKKHGIIPTTVIKAIRDILPVEEILKLEMGPLPRSKTAMLNLIATKEKEMKISARELDFELAAILRDEIRELMKKANKFGKSKPPHLSKK